MKFLITVELLEKCDLHNCTGKRKSLNLNLYMLKAFESDYRTMNTIKSAFTYMDNIV